MSTPYGGNRGRGDRADTPHPYPAPESPIAPWTAPGVRQSRPARDLSTDAARAGCKPRPSRGRSSAPAPGCHRWSGSPCALGSATPGTNWIRALPPRPGCHGSRPRAGYADGLPQSWRGQRRKTRPARNRDGSGRGRPRRRLIRLWPRIVRRSTIPGGRNGGRRVGSLTCPDDMKILRPARRTQPSRRGGASSVAGRGWAN